MSKALVTYAAGPHRELLDIALPSFQRFADRHGYEVIVAGFDEQPRPASWMKVPALASVLQEHEEALWVDADVVIVDGEDDLPVDDWAWQALVEHETADGCVPNLGVWHVRRPMLEILDRVWQRVDLIDHGWWEQAAVVALMGYGDTPLRRVASSELYRNTCFLDAGWNVHRNDGRTTARPRFMHATMWPDRVAVMSEWAQKADVCVC